MTRRIIRASLQLLATEQGGRSAPITATYRSLARFEGTEADYGFELELDSETLAPGETGVGRLSFWAVDEMPELQVGSTFEMREGARVVGRGTVLDPDVA